MPAATSSAALLCALLCAAGGTAAVTQDAIDTQWMAWLTARQTGWWWERRTAQPLATQMAQRSARQMVLV